MFKRRTLFVVGAGASREVGFPLGATLAKAIGQRLFQQTDTLLFQQLRDRHPDDFIKYYEAAQRISAGIHLANSIDDFLNVHSDNEKIKEVGKAAIVRSILEAEQGSALYVNPENIEKGIDWAAVEDTWFVKLMRILGPGVRVADVDFLFDNVNFIVFNYDRCLEHFLFHALRTLYGIGAEAATKIVCDISIIHPYGTVGPLSSIPFGSVGGDHFTLASRIKTYTEQIEESHVIDSIHEMVHRAQCIVFLGLAYAEQNMALLKPSRSIERKPVFGTAYGLSQSDREVVARRIRAMMEGTDAIEMHRVV